MKVPFIRFGGRYFLSAPPVLFRRLETFVYDTIKEQYGNISKFNNVMSPIFEKYIEKGLDYCNANWMGESKIQNNLPPGVKNPDFLLTSEDGMCLIDAKAIESPPRGMVFSLPGDLKSVFKTNIIKGIKQCVQYAAHLSQSVNQEKHAIPPFLLIVTLKETYLSGGRHLQDILGNEDISKLFSHDGFKIDPQRLFIICADDFDLLCQSAKDNNLTIPYILNRCMLNNLGGAITARYMLNQHLVDDLKGIEPLPYSQSETVRFMNVLIEEMQKVRSC